jgi:NAD(P)-dependent dehydrogenase (short-subunit alcohol dehydrogenase family)
MTDSLFDLRDKVAVVTGGSRGIGRMIATGLVERGVRVYISARKADQVQAAQAELAALGQCAGIVADVSSEAGAAELASAVGEREEKVHILVNNAGAAWGAPLEEYPESGFDKVLGTNVKGPFFVTQKLLPQLRAAASEADPARVINIGSVDALLTPRQPNFAYSASKAAVHWLTRHLAQELMRDHILVNAIAPGFFRTKMTEFLFTDDEAEGRLEAVIPAHRLGRQDDIAGTVIYLSSRAGSYVTGAVIPVGGGIEVIAAG